MYCLEVHLQMLLVPSDYRGANTVAAQTTVRPTSSRMIWRSFFDAIELGKIAERDQSPVCIEKIPSVSDRKGWRKPVNAMGWGRPIARSSWLTDSRRTTMLRWLESWASNGTPIAAKHVITTLRARQARFHQLSDWCTCALTRDLEQKSCFGKPHFSA